MQYFSFYFSLSLQAYALYRTRLPVSIVHQSLLLLSRLKQRYPTARGTSSSPHRLFLSSLMLSAKISMDDTYSNKSWAIVGSDYFALKEVNQMERELFAFLGWNVVVSKDELGSFVTSASSSWVEEQQMRMSERRKRRKLEEEAAREARHQQARNAARALLRPHTYRHPSPSPVRSLTSSVQSCPSSMSASPCHSHLSSPLQTFRRTSMPEVSSSSSSSSSAFSSAFPSAAHSPTSPASAPLSAGPQTPESDHCDVFQSHIHPFHEESPDFPEAATYVSRVSKCKSLSPLSGRTPSSTCS